MPEILTATQLRLLAMCERRVWLDKFGDKNLRDDVSGKTYHAFQRGIEHEATIHAVTSPNLITVTVETWQDAIKANQIAMKNGAKVLLNASLEVLVKLNGKQDEVLFRGRIDRLERHTDGFYFPIEIKQYKELSEGDFLQLDFYCFLLGKIQGVIPDGEFWLSAQADGFPEKKISHIYNHERFEAVLARWVNLFRFKKPPQLIYESYCRKCHWQSFCIDELKKTNSINLLWKLHKTTRRDLHARGIFTLEQFATLSLDEIKELKGIDTTAPRYKAHAEAYINKVPTIYAELASIVKGGGIMFDLETEAIVWCMGWIDIDGNVKIAIVNPEHDTTIYKMAEGTEIHIVESSDAAWWLFYEHVKHLDTPIFHWTKYDSNAMKKTAPKEIQEALMPRMHDLADSFIKSVQLPIRNYSLKDVARYFGFNWQTYDNWMQALWDYRIWKDTGANEYLERAASYQRDDVLSMLVVWRWMIGQQKG